MVSPSLLALSLRILAWIVVTLAMLGFLGNAVQGILDGRLDRLLWWIVVAALSMGASAQAEKLKAFLEARSA